MKYFNLLNFLKSKNVIKIYKGKDDCCRCGCGGKYYYKKFENLLNDADLEFQTLNEYGDYKTKSRFFMEEAQGNKEGFINIPIYNKNNKCYCIYYKNKAVA